MVITDKNDPLLVTDKNIFGVEVHKLPITLEVYIILRDILEGNIPTTLEVYTIPITLEAYNIPENILEAYNIPGNILEGNIPTTLEVYTIPITLEAYNIPENIFEAYNVPGNILEACNIPTTDSTLEIYDIPGNMLEVYNISNTRDNFAGNFDTRAGSSDRLTSDPVLATSGCLKVSDNFQPCKFGIYNYNSFALENTIAGADSRTKILDLNAVEKHTSQFQLRLFFSHFNIYGTFPN